MAGKPATYRSCQVRVVLSSMHVHADTGCSHMDGQCRRMLHKPQGQEPSPGAHSTRHASDGGVHHRSLRYASTARLAVTTTRRDCTAGPALGTPRVVAHHLLHQTVKREARVGPHSVAGVRGEGTSSHKLVCWVVGAVLGAAVEGYGRCKQRVNVLGADTGA